MSSALGGRTVYCSRATKEPVCSLISALFARLSAGQSNASGFEDSAPGTPVCLDKTSFVVALAREDARWATTRTRGFGRFAGLGEMALVQWPLETTTTLVFQ